MATFAQLERSYLKIPHRRSTWTRRSSVRPSVTQIHLMAFLVDCGAADLDRALVQSAMRNQVSACRWLVSPERYVPAESLEAAQLAAAATNALEAEWLLVSIRRQLRDRKKRRNWFDDLF